MFPALKQMNCSRTVAMQQTAATATAIVNAWPTILMLLIRWFYRQSRWTTKIRSENKENRKSYLGYVYCV